MIYWSSFFVYLTILFLYFFLFLLFLRKQIFFFRTIAIIFFIRFNIFGYKSRSRMNLYLRESSFLVIRGIIDDMIVLLFMLSVVIIWWSWLDFLESRCGITAVILWICSYDWLLIFIAITVVFLFFVFESLAFICLLFLDLGRWWDLLFELSGLTLILGGQLYWNCFLYRFIMLFCLSHLNNIIIESFYILSEFLFIEDYWGTTITIYLFSIFNVSINEFKEEIDIPSENKRRWSKSPYILSHYFTDNT